MPIWVRADAANLPLPDRSVDLVLGSPPYIDKRTYGIGFKLDVFDWVEWMLKVTAECLRVSRGAVIWVAAGGTKNRNYLPACEGLMWEWFKRGGKFLDDADAGRYKRRRVGSMYRPAYWDRVGIAGSGGDQWLRSDVEHCMCFKRAGGLPYADNTAHGKPPKYAPGGAMSHRLSDGSRRNQWGGSGSGKSRRKDGKLGGGVKKPSHVAISKSEAGPGYKPPWLANPGNVIRGIPVGGGLMGHRLAHENEAPFPERLARYWIAMLTRDGDTVLDPFSGSGTTVSVAQRSGRRGVGLDLRHDQCVLGRRRYGEQATVFDPKEGG